MCLTRCGDFDVSTPLLTSLISIKLFLHQQDIQCKAVIPCRDSSSPVSPHGSGSSASGGTESGKSGTSGGGGLSGWGIFGIVLGVVVLGALGRPSYPLMPFDEYSPMVLDSSCSISSVNLPSKTGTE